MRRASCWPEEVCLLQSRIHYRRRSDGPGPHAKVRARGEAVVFHVNAARRSRAAPRTRRRPEHAARICTRRAAPSGTSVRATLVPGGCGPADSESYDRRTWDELIGADPSQSRPAPNWSSFPTAPSPERVPLRTIGLGLSKRGFACATSAAAPLHAEMMRCAREPTAPAAARPSTATAAVNRRRCRILPACRA